jgi:hypothetical protein
LAENKVYVVHFEGKRLDGNRAAYLIKGAAKAEVTRQCHYRVAYELGISQYYEREKYDAVFELEKSKYDVVEYVPRGDE